MLSCERTLRSQNSISTRRVDHCPSCTHTDTDTGDQGEHIVKRVIPLQHLYATLQGTSDTCDEYLAVTAADYSPDYDKNGFAIDALVASVAEGWKLARTFANSS